MRLTFHGAARQVTGSCFGFEVGHHRFLVDCGLFQGARATREANTAPFAFDPATLDFVVLTHAHLDHCGLLPRLAAEGFSGPVFATAATRDITAVLLRDSAYLQGVEQARAQRRGGDYVAAYTMADVDAVLPLIRTVGYDDVFEPAKGVRVCLRDAGHILGSASIELWLDDGVNRRKVVVSGDLGQPGRPIVRDPTPIAAADVLLLESTYGNRAHDPDDNGEQFARIVSETYARGGKLIIPSFAIGRANEVVYWLDKLEEQQRIPALPVYVDSPMAARAFGFYAQHSDQLDADMRTGRQGVRAFFTTRMTMVASPQQSREVVASRKPAIVIASSGMATGGRVLYHLREALPDPRNTVMFVGYQAAGTRGRRLLDGEPSVRLKGMDVPVHARIERLDSMSAHADVNEIMRWLGHFTRPPQATYLVHGEGDALQSLKARIATEKQWQVAVAGHQQQVEL